MRAEQLEPILLYILPGASRQEDLIRLPAYLAVDHSDLGDRPVDDYLASGHQVRVIVDMEAKAKTYPFLAQCNFYPCDSIQEMAGLMGKRCLVLDPVCSTDPLVRSNVTQYVALKDGTAHKLVAMGGDLVYARQMPCVIEPNVLEILHERVSETEFEAVRQSGRANAFI
jgi:hypothetical protein